MSQQQKLDTQLLQPFLKQLPQGMVVKHIKTLKASSRSDEQYDSSSTQNVQIARWFKSDTRLPISEIQLFKLLKKQAGEISWEDNNTIKFSIDDLLSRNLEPKYTIGDQFQKVTEVDRINFDENSYTKENSSFEPENGVVYLVVIWDTINERCDKLMPLIESMVQRNPNWKGKAKIVGISADYKIEKVFQLVNENNWKSMEHYRLQDYWENNLKLFLPNSDFPMIILINKWGKVVGLDVPSESNLEERINQEINAEQEIPAAKQEIQQNNEQLLTKEEFKYLKGKVYSIQEAINEISFLGKVNVTLEKINVWKPDGTKEVLKRSKLKFEYDLRVTELDKLNNFLENHYWNTIPENLKEITQTKISDPIQQQQEIKAKYQETYAAQGVTINYYNIDTHTYKYNNQIQQFEFKTDSQVQAEAQGLTFDRHKTTRWQIKNDLRDYNDEIEDDTNRKIIREISDSLDSYVMMDVGKQFETIKNYKKWGSEEYVNIEHKPGQVLILIYWNNFINSCFEEIEKANQSIKQNAEKWGNEVRIVCLSTGSEEDAKDAMDSHEEWQKQIEFYFPKRVCQDDVLKLGSSNYPLIMTVDQLNTIRNKYSGFYIEDVITTLLNEQQPQPKEEKVEIQVDPAQIQEILVSSNALLTQADPQKVLELELVFKSRTFNNPLIISKPKLSFSARDTQEQQVQLVLNQLFNVIPEAQWTISKTIYKTVSIPYPGQECAVCKKDITQEPQQYYSPFKYEHVCTECAEYDDKEKKGNARFKYLDTLVFINGPLSDPSVLHNIDDHKLGKNKKLQDGDEGSQVHLYMSCCGCGVDLQGARYISITAKPGRYRNYGYIDYCQNCFQSLKDKTTEKAKEIVAKDINEGMVLDSLFTRVLFYHEGYQDF